MLGAQIGGPQQREFNGLQVEMWPRVSWSPSFALTFADLEVSHHTLCMSAKAFCRPDYVLRPWRMRHCSNPCKLSFSNFNPECQPACSCAL